MFGVGVWGALEAIGAFELFKATPGLGLVPRCTWILWALPPPDNSLHERGKMKGGRK